MLRSATQLGCRLPPRKLIAAPRLSVGGQRTFICIKNTLRSAQPFQPAPDHAVGTRDVTVAAASSAAPPSDPSITFKKRFWTFIDVVAILGSVGGALAAILNLFSGTYVLFLPLVLPVVSLLSALQREGLIAEDNRRAYDTLRASLARDSSGLLGEARSAIDDVRRELKGQSTTAARLATIEARLSSLEGSILSVGRAAREAAAGLGMLPERLGGEQRVVLEGLVGAMRVELRRAAESLANNETTALARLDARLAAVEGSLSGLEVAQSEGMRRLGMSLNSALADAEATLQSSVRNEVARSMEPVRRLPQMLAAALPPALAAAEAVEASANGGGLIGAGGGGGAGAGVSPEQVQAIVGQEVEMAVGRILDFQAEGFGRLGAVRPTPMDDEQWGALGRRLSRLERLVEGVPAAAEGSLVQNGALAAAVAAAVRDAVAAQLAEARVEAAAAAVAAAAAEGERVRNDVLAAQVVLREGLDGLTAALTPLQLGVTEVSVAVATMAEAQREAQAAAAAATVTAVSRQEDGDGGGALAAAAPPAALAPAELSRLLDGVAAVAALLRDVDTKVGSVAAAVERLPAEVAAAAALAEPAAGASAGAVLARDGSGDGQAAAAAATAAAAAAAAQQQQRELQAGIESMRAALAALAGQVGELASKATTAPTAASVAATAVPVTATAAAAPAPAKLSDVLAFEAGLVAGAAADAAAAASGAAVAEAQDEAAAAAVAGATGRAPPATTGASREQAYDLMLQLAEARRRSGSEAGSSGSSSEGGGSSDAGSGSGGSGSRGSGGARVEVSAAVVTAEAHLRIDGLPPFEHGTAIEELSPLPPSQHELEATASAPELPLPPQQSVGLDQQQQQQWQPQQQQQQQQWQTSEGEEAASSAAAGGYGYGYGGWQGQDPPQQWQPQPPQAGSQPQAHGGGDGQGYGYAEGLGPNAGVDEVAEAAAYAAAANGQQSSWGTAAAPPPPRQQQLQQTPPPAWPAAPAAQPPPQQQQPQQQAFAQQQQQHPAFSSPQQPHMPPPPQQQQQQQQQPGLGVGGGVSPDYRMRPLEGLTPNEVISEGLRLLRLGREETRKGEDYGLADTLLQSAVAAFTSASDLAPADAKALGNLGNALLARGELKAAYLEALRAGPPPATYAEAEAQRGAETAMTGEANALLTQAGLMFMKVLEMEGWSSRALVNWGRALVLRADLLAAAPEALAPGSAAAAAVAQLYTSAINKFEGVLEGEPDMIPAKYRCALAMAGLSRTKAAGSREALTLLADAINYLRDVLASPSPDAEALRGAAAAALAAMEQQLMAARAGRVA